ncbi:hypothetical protein MJH12_11655 [bacterium]|nr:hypothetical protein [bacterium]
MRDFLQFLHQSQKDLAFECSDQQLETFLKQAQDFSSKIPENFQSYYKGICGIIASLVELSSDDRSLLIEKIDSLSILYFRSCENESF